MVDPDAKTVIADAFGFAKLRAIFREGCGCTILRGITEDNFRQQRIGYIPAPPVFARAAFETAMAGRRPWAGCFLTATPTSQAPKGEYGALFWLNAGAPENPSDRLMPPVPQDVFYARGFQEQRVFIVPSRKLVLVRFGATSDKSAWSDDSFVADVLAALPQ